MPSSACKQKILCFVEDVLENCNRLYYLLCKKTTCRGSQIGENVPKLHSTATGGVKRHIRDESRIGAKGAGTID